MYASASSYVEVDGNSIFGNNVAKLDGGEECLDVRRGPPAPRRFAYKKQPRTRSYGKATLTFLLQLIHHISRKWSKSDPVGR